MGERSFAPRVKLFAAGRWEIGVLAMLVMVCGCLPPVQKSDLESGTTDFSGTWLGDEPGVRYWFKQENKKVTGGKMTGAEGTGVAAFDGTVTGRVLRGQYNNFMGGLAGFQMVASADGRTAQYHDTFEQARTLYRVVLGSPAKYLNMDSAISESGAILCQLPVDSGGGVRSGPGNDAKMRDVLVALANYNSDDGSMHSGRNVIPVDAPRKAGEFSIAESGFDSVMPTRRQLRAARTGSTYYLKQRVNLDGTQYWLETAPYWSGSDLMPSMLILERYTADPDSGAAPFRGAVIATRDNTGNWQSRQSYLASGSGTSLNTIHVVFANGKPQRIETSLVEKPPIEHFLHADTSVDVAKFNNRALLVAKNRTLPDVLRQSETRQLNDLMTKLEQAALELTHGSEMAKERAQRSVEAGKEQQNVERERELSLLLKERVTILQQILAGVKEELSNRSK
ncbi:MAG TPA: hypothetical protein VGP94_09485 [Tepidisphaeraceae bacterium]|jgi:hypothetical protein|nr:hypothetical protein [Tepidisphaeraceae bacterium]